MTDPAAFYERVAPERFRATSATESPWDRRLQHGGPPSALLAAYAQSLCDAPSMRLARVTVEFLGPIPLAELHLRGRVVRSGRQVRLIDVAAEHDGRDVALARAWFIATLPAPDATLAAIPPRREPAPALPAAQEQRYFPGLDPAWGYGRAIEWRFTEGGFLHSGPCRVWTRPRVPLIAGETSDGFARALVVADSANGLSAELSFRDWLFIPPSITVTLGREAAGEWVYLEAVTHVASDGVGFCNGALADERGWLGVVAQPLLVTKRQAT